MHTGTQCANRHSVYTMLLIMHTATKYANWYIVCTLTLRMYTGILLIPCDATALLLTYLAGKADERIRQMVSNCRLFFARQQCIK